MLLEKIYKVDLLKKPMEQQIQKDEWKLSIEEVLTQCCAINGD